MTDLAGLGLTAVLLLFNGFFVGAEFALISARRTMIEPRAEQGSRSARMTLSAMENVSLMMAGAQLGITICSLALGLIAEPAIAHLLEVPFEAAGVPSALLHPVALTIALSLVTYLHVVIGEMVPKNIALAGPDRVALLLAPLLVVIVRILFPVLWVLNGIANIGLRALRVTPKDEVTSAFTRDEVAALVGESRSGGLIELNDERLLLGALSFGERDVRSVLLPLATVRTLPQDVTPEQAEQASAQGFSRFPLTDPDGRLTGYVHIKDLLVTEVEERGRPIRPDVVRTLPTVQARDSLRSVLSVMQRTSAHLAAVVESVPDGAAGADVAPIDVAPVDGAAGASSLGPVRGLRTVGVVTLEDVLEELVGEIRDDSRRLASS